MPTWTALLVLGLLAGGCGTPKPTAIESNDGGSPGLETPPTPTTGPPTSENAEKPKANAVTSAQPILAAPVGRMEAGFFVTDEAPAPQACATDDECKGDTVPDATGCCQEPTQVVPHARAYAAWVQKWRAGACVDVTCPPPPSPAQPNACLFDVRCAQGVCTNSCPTPAH